MSDFFNKAWEFTKTWGWILFPPLAIAAWSLDWAKKLMMPDINLPGSPAPELQLTQNKVGALIPDLLGTAKPGGTLLYYGREWKRKRGSKSRRRYWYYMTWAVGFCEGEVDTLYTIFSDEKVLWSGTLNKPTSGGTTTLPNINGFSDSGSIRVYFGTDDQEAPALIATHGIVDSTLNCPYRGLFYILFDNCMIGVNSKRMPSIRVVARKAPVYAFNENNEIETYDYNPIHATWHILETMTGLPASWLDTTDFSDAADNVGIVYESTGWEIRDPVGDADDHRWTDIACNSSGGRLIVAADDGNYANEIGRVYTSSDYGETWTERQPLGDDDKIWRAVASSYTGQHLMCCNWIGRVCVSDDYGVTWTDVQPTGDVNAYWINVAVSGNGQYMLCTWNGGMAVSDDYGATWTTRQPSGSSELCRALCVNYSGTIMVAGTQTRLYISTDYGVNWNETQPAGDVSKSWWTCDCNYDGSVIGAGVSNGRLYISENSGSTWAERRPDGDNNRAWQSISFADDGEKMLVCASTGSAGNVLFSSVDTGVAWTAESEVPGPQLKSTAINATGTLRATCDYTSDVLTSRDTAIDLGISILFSAQKSALSYIEAILDHIDCILKYESDAKFHPKLIRDDYTIASLPEIDGNVFLEKPTLRRKAWIDTLNEIKVQYSLLGRDASVVDLRQSTANPVAVDMGNYGIQGRTVTKTIQFAFFTLNTNAIWAASNALLKASYPLAAVELKLNRDMFQLEPGDCCKYSYTDTGISNMILRVLNVEEESLESEDITVTAIEDFFSISSSITSYSDPAPAPTELPDYTIVYFTYQKVIETPYDLIADPAVFEVLPVAGRAAALDDGFEFNISNDGGSSYSMIDDMENIVPHGLLVGVYPETLTIDNEYGFVIDFIGDVEQIEDIAFSQTLEGNPNMALLGDEIIFFQTIAQVSGSQYKIETVIRGRMDTVKQAHPEDTVFYFLGSDSESIISSSLIAGATRGFKLVPYNSLFYGNVDSATNINVAITGRAQTPYPPVNLTANDEILSPEYTDDIVLEWSPRMRGLGAGTGIPGTILPSGEHEGYFEVEIWVADTLMRTTNAINTDTWTYTEAMNISDNGSLADTVVCKALNYQTVDAIAYESSQATVTCTKA